MLKIQIDSDRIFHINMKNHALITLFSSTNAYRRWKFSIGLLGDTLAVPIQVPHGISTYEVDYHNIHPLSRFGYAARFYDSPRRYTQSPILFEYVGWTIADHLFTVKP